MIDPKTIQELKAQHGDDNVYVLDNADVAFRRPTRAEWRAVKTSHADPAKRPLANDQLASLVVIHPDKAAFDALCERFPALADVVANNASAAAQNAATTDAKKA